MSQGKLIRPAIVVVGEGEIESGKDVKMVFRFKAIDEARGFTRYFWKAVPI